MTASSLGQATSLGPARTAPALVAHARSGAHLAVVPAQRRRRPRPHVAQAPAWSCENCSQVNPGRRRRCLDCGTSHY